MTYSYGAWQSIVTQWNTYYGGGGSLAMVYRDTQAIMASGLPNSSIPAHYADIVNVLDLGLLAYALIGNRYTYRAEILFDFVVPQYSAAQQGYLSESLVDNDRNFAHLVSAQIAITGALANFFDTPFFLAPVAAPGDVYELVSLRLHSMDQPRFFASGKKLLRYHIYWTFRQI